MSDCDNCPDPGHCCTSFPLSKEFAFDWNRKEVQQWLDTQGFQQVRPLRRLGNAIGEGLTRWLFSCTWLNDEGRCSRYSERPDFCKSYDPGYDALCALADASKFSVAYANAEKASILVAAMTEDEQKLLKDMLYGDGLSEVQGC